MPEDMQSILSTPEEEYFQMPKTKNLKHLQNFKKSDQNFLENFKMSIKIVQKLVARNYKYNLLIVLVLTLVNLTCANSTEDSSPSTIKEGCPWTNDLRISSKIRTNCQCARNSPTVQLSIQCTGIELSQLLSVLNDFQLDSLELLYLNSSLITSNNDSNDSSTSYSLAGNTNNGLLPSHAFRDLKIVSLQLSECGIRFLHPDSLRGQQSTLKHLSLTMNQLKDVPTLAFSKLRNLSLLDLSFNRLGTIQSNAFLFLKNLTTLKLNDNHLNFHDQAFKGLESSLKNLNLKGTRLTRIPEAIRNLNSLTFLDLAQNRIREIDAILFRNLKSLTALNLERNLLQTLPSRVFEGVNGTLSSLSLLNNLMTTYPKQAIQQLQKLRVLDLGFNLFSEIPTDAFEGLQKLTLLALDGNPLTTIPEEPFLPIKSTLRGLSIGGRFLQCDCRINWILRWIQKYDLQVTSREKNPQYCSAPIKLRSLSFYQMNAKDLRCDINFTTPYIYINNSDFSMKSDQLGEFEKTSSSNNEASITRNELQQSASTNSDSSAIGDGKSSFSVNSNNPTKSHTSMTSSRSTIVTYSKTRSKLIPVNVNKLPFPKIRSTPKNPLIPSSPQRSNKIFLPPKQTIIHLDQQQHLSTASPFDDSNIPIITGSPRPIPIGRARNVGSVVQVRVTPAPTTTVSSSLYTGENSQNIHTSYIHQPTSSAPTNPEIQIENIQRLGESVLVHWSTSASVENGFRVIYRIFGEDAFRHGPPLAPTETEYQILGIPSFDCVVVCVIPYEEILYNEVTSSESIPPSRHCRELKPPTPSSTSFMTHMDKVTIGATGAICVIVALAVLILVIVTRRSNNSKALQQHGIIKIPTGYSTTPSPPNSGRIGSLTPIKDWDQLSMISSKSIPRIRLIDGTHPHQQPTQSLANGVARGIAPRTATGLHRTYLSQPHLNGANYLTGQTNRLFEQNNGRDASTGGLGVRAASHRQLSFQTHRHRPVHHSQSQLSSSNTHLFNNHNHRSEQFKRKKRSHTTTTDSQHTLSGYDTPDNWTDHDMELYIEQNGGGARRH